MFTKLGKKIMAFFAVALLSLSLASCISGSKGATLEEAQANVDSVIQAIVYDSTVLSDVTANLNAVKQNANYPDVKIEWSSSEEDIVSFATNAQGIHQMVINRPKSDDARVVDGYAPVTVTVTASQVVADGTATNNKSFNLKVKVLDNQFFGTVAEITANYLNYLKDNNIAKDDAYSNKVYSVTYGRVEYIFSKGFFITDGDAGIYVYGNTTGLKVGDLVKVSGQIYLYWGQLEFGSEQNVEVLSATDKVVDLDGNDTGRTQASFVQATYEEKGIKEYTDVIANSYETYITNPAGYANYSGATYTLTAQVVKEDLATGDSYALVDPIYGTKIALYHYCTDSEEATAKFDALNGKYVNIQVITVDRYSTNNMFRVLWNGSEITETTAPELTDQQKADKAAYEISNAVLPALFYNGDTFTAPTTTVEGVTVAWAANEHVVDGKIVATEAGTATLTATVTCGEATATATITINLEAKEIINTIAEFVAATDGDVLTIKGVIVAKFGSNGKYAYVQDETGTILVYASLENKIGDTVKLLATKGSYNGTPQVKSDNLTETLVEEGEWTIATPTQVTVATVKAYTAATAPFGAYLQASGKLVKSGNYYYLSDGTNQISLYNSNVPEDLAQYADTDHEVTLNFYMYGNSKSDWSGDLRVIFCGREGEYVLPQLSDAEQAEVILSSIVVGSNAATDFTLPEVEGVVWSIKEGTAATLDGHTVTIVRPEAGQEDATVVFTATLTLNETPYTKDFTVTIPAEEAAETLTLTAANLLGYAGTNVAYSATEASNTVNEIAWSYKGTGAYGTGIQCRTNDGTGSSTIWNTTATKKIAKIVITYHADKYASVKNITNALKVDFGNEALATTCTQYMSTVAGTQVYEIVPDAATYTFVTLTHNCSNTLYIESITLVFAE